MLTFPNCKINIGLRILRRRQDGFHDIKTFFYPLPFYDILEIVPSTRVTLHLSGIPVAGKAENNLCMRAYQLLKKDFPALPPYAIYLHKNIPTGAGLGGGSADAAFMLKLINQKAQLHLTNEKLQRYAAQLGSDCSFFVEGQPALAAGRGEILQPTSILHHKNHAFVIICPEVSINTGRAYQNIRPQKEDIPLDQLLQTPVSSWKGQVKNDFEPAVFHDHPHLQKIKAALYAQGAIYASLSGSGSTLYGIFPKDFQPDPTVFPFNENLTKTFTV